MLCLQWKLKNDGVGELIARDRVIADIARHREMRDPIFTAKARRRGGNEGIDGIDQSGKRRVTREIQGILINKKYMLRGGYA
jgi:hypothetical protein